MQMAKFYVVCGLVKAIVDAATAEEAAQIVLNNPDRYRGARGTIVGVSQRGFRFDRTNPSSSNPFPDCVFQISQSQGGEQWQH